MLLHCTVSSAIAGTLSKVTTISSALALPVSHINSTRCPTCRQEAASHPSASEDSSLSRESGVDSSICSFSITCTTTGVLQKACIRGIRTFTQVDVMAQHKKAYRACSLEAWRASPRVHLSCFSLQKHRIMALFAVPSNTTSPTTLMRGQVSLHSQFTFGIAFDCNGAFRAGLANVCLQTTDLFCKPATLMLIERASSQENPAVPAPDSKVFDCKYSTKVLGSSQNLARLKAQSLIRS